MLLREGNERKHIDASATNTGHRQSNGMGAVQTFVCHYMFALAVKALDEPPSLVLLVSLPLVRCCHLIYLHNIISSNQLPETRTYKRQVEEDSQSERPPHLFKIRRQP